MEQSVKFAFNNGDEQYLQPQAASRFLVPGGPSSFNQVQSTTHVEQPSCYQQGGQLDQQQPERQLFQHREDNTNTLENKKKPWGNELSYAQMVIHAISSSPEQRLTLSEIYAFLIENYEFFAKNSGKEGWKNSIRHNLSLQKYFVRTPIPGSGKLSSWWSIDYVELKRRKRKHTRDEPYPAGSVSNVMQSNRQRDEQNLSAPSYSHLLQRPTQQSGSFTTYNNYSHNYYTHFNQNSFSIYGRDQQPPGTYAQNSQLIHPQQQQMPRKYYQMPQPVMPPFQQRAPLQNPPVAGQQNLPSTSYDNSMDIKHTIGQYLQKFCAAHESGGSCTCSCENTPRQQSNHQQLDLPSQNKTIQLTTQQYHSSSWIQQQKLPQIYYDQNNSNKPSDKNPICNYGGEEKYFQQPPGMYYARNSQTAQPQQQQLPWKNYQLQQTQMAQRAMLLQQQHYQKMVPTQNPPVGQQQCLPSTSNDHKEKGTIIGQEGQYCCATRERQGYCYCSTTQTLPLSAQLMKDHDKTLSFYWNDEAHCCATCGSHGFCNCDNKTQALAVAPACQSTLPGDDQELRAQKEEFDKILMAVKLRKPGDGANS